ncbi:MAG: AAA family ATPase [Burkholderiales bacterium]|nr:AAA family ATPase [Burkholderiales bacterium]
MIMSLMKHKKLVLRSLALVSAAALAALVWFTLHAPERARNPLAVAMERESTTYFAAERDLTALAQDARSGAAAGIGLSAEYVLVSRHDGERYYVRTDAQRALVTELLKGDLGAHAPEIFALDRVQPPGPPLTAFARKFDPAWLSLLLPLLFIGVLIYMNPGRGGASFKTAARPGTRFADVVGVTEAKEALQDIVAYLRNPAKFAQLGARPPKGVVLEGHFGCGKTLLARAVAGEAGVPFIALSGSDFTDMFLGVGVRRVKKLFAAARAQAPCVVFIDEIDGLGKRSGGASAGETENNRIINALLVELDGFTSTSGIVVLGATNNVANLDPALIRAGRFDRTCHLGLPDVDEREALYALHAKALRTAGELDYRQLARVSSGLPPASIANIVNAAGLMAAKEGADAVTQRHLQRMLEQHLMGGSSEAGRSALDPAERNRIAVHEAGHAIIARLLDVGVVEKVSILKRGRALGVTLVTNEQDLTLQSEPEMRARMAMLLAGRAAELLLLRNVSTGAANDLERVSNMAYRMVTEFGFGKELGPFSYAGLPERDRPLATCQDAIAEARDLIKELEQECAALLRSNRRALELLTTQLLEHETVSGEVVSACIASNDLPAAA